MSTFACWKLLYSLLYISLRPLVSSVVQKTAHLKPSSISTLPGISLSTSSSVTILNDKWSIDVSTQHGSDMHISLDNNWGFHPLYPSSLQLYIQGKTSNETFYDDGEILFVFGVNNEYFAEMISIDKRKSSYKECPNSNDKLIPRNLTEMIYNIEPDRYHRFCKNSVTTPRNLAQDYWKNVGSVHKLPAQWPMFLNIINNPIDNTISYAWTDSINGLNRVTSFYTSSFTPNQGLNIYISGESPNEDFYIFSIDITYRHTFFSYPPTINPTNEPTQIPTISPTNNPSITPTYTPTVFPSKFPTYSPTINPTSFPSFTPTLSPTIDPSYNPTYIPTIEPTYYPTIEPTKNPLIPGQTYNPTIISTDTPTYIPTDIPTDIPTTNIPTYNYILTIPNIKQTKSEIEPIVITNLIHTNSTKIIVLNANKSTKKQKMSLVQILVILFSIFIFFAGWFGFFAFVWFSKNKPKGEESEDSISKNTYDIYNITTPTTHNNSHDENISILPNGEENSSNSPNYKSESALIPDDNLPQTFSPINTLEINDNINKVNDEYNPSTGSSNISSRRSDSQMIITTAAIINNDINNPMDSSINNQSETSVINTNSLNNNYNCNNIVGPIHEFIHNNEISDTIDDDTMSDETDETDDTSESDEFIYQPTNKGPNDKTYYKPFEVLGINGNNLHLKHSLMQQQHHKRQKSVSNSMLSIHSLYGKEKPKDDEKKNNNYQESVFTIDI